MRTIHCDKCGKAIPDQSDRFRIRVERYNQHDQIMGENHFVGLPDVCEQCRDAIMRTFQEEL